MWHFDNIAAYTTLRIDSLTWKVKWDIEVNILVTSSYDQGRQSIYCSCRFYHQHLSFIDDAFSDCTSVAGWYSVESLIMAKCHLSLVAKQSCRSSSFTLSTMIPQLAAIMENFPIYRLLTHYLEHPVDRYYLFNVDESVCKCGLENGIQEFAFVLTYMMVEMYYLIGLNPLKSHLSQNISIKSCTIKIELAVIWIVDWADD